MAMKREDVEHVARLARLDLRDDEVEMFTEQLGRIIGYVDKLAELDVTGVEPMMHAAEGAAFREDVPAETLERRKALGGSPSASDGFFRVPPVIDSSH
jgi:aspartyl-tRNA(Asn)/glutamyl-tRNA(Gln) amidotransferase subunit C